MMNLKSFRDTFHSSILPQSEEHQDDDIKIELLSVQENFNERKCIKKYDIWQNLVISQSTNLTEWIIIQRKRDELKKIQICKQENRKQESC